MERKTPAESRRINEKILESLEVMRLTKDAEYQKYKYDELMNKYNTSEARVIVLDRQIQILESEVFKLEHELELAESRYDELLEVR